MFYKMERLLYEGVKKMSKYKVEMNGYQDDYPKLTHQQTMNKLRTCFIKCEISFIISSKISSKNK